MGSGRNRSGGGRLTSTSPDLLNSAFRDLQTNQSYKAIAYLAAHDVPKPLTPEVVKFKNLYTLVRQFHTDAINDAGYGVRKSGGSGADNLLMGVFEQVGLL